MKAFIRRLSPFLYSLIYIGRAWETEREPFHTYEIYHIRGAEAGASYPLEEKEILRLLHVARYADSATRNSIQLRLRQAVAPNADSDARERQQCEVDEMYLTWSHSWQRPTPALASALSELMRRPSPGVMETEAPS